MLNYQLHIARFFCFLTAFLVSSGTIVNAIEIEKKLFSKQEITTNHENKLIYKFEKNSDTDDIFNLTKDPTEGDIDFFDMAYQEFLPIQFYFTPVLKDKQHFFFYNPVIKERPIWIRNRQIRI